MYYGNSGWYTFLAQKARDDFGRARQRALRNRLVSALTGRATCLLSFGEAEATIPIGGHLNRGLQTVPLARIVGSVGRYRDFDSNFNPIRADTRSRWVNIDIALLAGDGFPPVELYLLDGAYYVKDGNHRVSVARHVGMDTIEAVVIEYIAAHPPPVNIPLEAACACTMV